MRDRNPLVQRFRTFTALTADEEERVRSLSDERTYTKAARRDLIREGERPRVVYLILSGWAYRYKMLEDGRRQLLQFLVPGDLCDIHNMVLTEMDHSIGTATELRYAEISHDRLEELERDFPNLRRALWWHSMTTIAIQREWTTNIGQRTAIERLSHLFCELFLRLQVAGLTKNLSYDLPLTQTDLADATGLTSVHVNRTLQDMRKAGSIVLEHRKLTVPDWDALQRSALFSPEYLHLRSRWPPGPSTNSDDPRIL